MVSHSATASQEKQRIQRILSNYEQFTQGDPCWLCDVRPVEENNRHLILIMDYDCTKNLDLIDLLQNPNFTLILMTQRCDTEIALLKSAEPSLYLYYNPMKYPYHCQMWSDGNLVIDHSEAPRSPPPPPSTPYNERNEKNETDQDIQPHQKQIENRKQRAELKTLTSNEMRRLRKTETERSPAFTSFYPHQGGSKEWDLQSPKESGRVWAAMKWIEILNEIRNRDKKVAANVVSNMISLHDEKTRYEIVASSNDNWDDIWY